MCNIHILTMTYFHCWKFALWFFMQITRFLWVKEWNTNLFFSRANCSRCSLKKSDWTKSKGSYSLLGIKREKMYKTYKKYEFFEQIAFFCIWFPQITSHLLASLCWKEQRERFAHGCSFIKSDVSESLTVAL